MRACTGFCYPRETLIAYCRFAEKHNLHLIVDEI
jgi:1-aminocyclopropane-1-carboxylate synthase